MNLARLARLRIDGAIAGLMAISVGLGYYGLTAIIGTVSVAGADAASVALGTAAGFVVNGLAGPLVSAGIDRFGLRATVSAGALVTGGGFALTAMTDPAALGAGFVAIGVGTAATSYVPAEAAFRDSPHVARRLAIAFSAGTAGGMILAPGLAVLLSWGAPGTLVGVGVAYALVGVALARGLPPRGLPSREAAAFSQRQVPDGPSVTRGGRRDRLPAGRGRGAAVALALAVLSGVALAFQLNIIVLAERLGVEGGALTIAVMPAAALLGRLVVAVASTLVTARGLLTATVVTGVAGPLALVSATTPGVLLGSALIGLSLGWSVLAAPMLVSSRGASAGAYARLLLIVSLGYGAGSLALPLIVRGAPVWMVCVGASALCLLSGCFLAGLGPAARRAAPPR